MAIVQPFICTKTLLVMSFVILFFLTNSVACFATDGEAENPSVSFEVKPSQLTVDRGHDWMKAVNGNSLLSQLSIPGTHDSCALRNGLSFGFARCQSWQLDSQLQAGIRYLDIRCRHRFDRFHIYHGIIDQKISFSRVLEICYDFLNENPSECVIVSVKQEARPESVTRSFRETFDQEIESNRGRWIISNQTPTLRKARGRLVLVDRVGNLGGLAWREMQLQDDYQAIPSVKKVKIKQHFDSIPKVPDKRWFLNYCSGTVPSQLINPSSYASKINPFALNQVNRRLGKHLGVVVMDFPGDRLVQKIIESNFSGRPQGLQDSKD